MCGIVGYLGERDPKEVIMTGLKRLEYRGYDSAGVSIWDKGHFKRVRAEGKLVNLEKKLEFESFDGHIGIGHTRWATHGIPNEANAHPHTFRGVSIVHNGIIENYSEIRIELGKRGHTFESETDSELIAHLISSFLEGAQDFHSACLKAKEKLQGAYSVVAVTEHNPDQICAFKNGPPLILGIGEKEFVVASDIQAIVPWTKNIIHIEDGEFLLVNKDSYSLFSSDGKLAKKNIITIDWSEEVAEKRGFPFFMLKEIFEQPRAVAQAIKPFLTTDAEPTISLSAIQWDNPADLKRLVESERLFIVACGTSYYAGMVGEYLVEKFAGIPVEVDLASEFRYRDPIIPKNTTVLFISQSGETADTLAALRLAKEYGALIVSLVNVKGSSIDRESQGRIAMKADVEVGVASTKAYTSTLAILNCLAIGLGLQRGRVTPAEAQEQVRSLQALPSLLEKALNYSSFFQESAEFLSNFNGILYIGRGVSYPVALEGALKLKELAYMHAEGYAAGELKHGPIALIDNKMGIVVIAPKDHVYEKSVSNLEEVRARGGIIISIGSGDDEHLQRLSKFYISIPQVTWNLSPILSVVATQLLAYHVAVVKGLDVDQPRNLAKSVTVE
ncbi:MAG: glutamine--fructose-6-phosphate transaminase (isomerizing) [Bdellovibrionales bacterium CG10_big_fil_rev_8_21_14_0_10_45_34]|nr:MAG: glutamine--fructose-6-phosphate transaminase (isomerizing) [Bdellovibrionales bacterium CG10_big_fil_rev_8_21_14_0_10_45_34]